MLRHEHINPNGATVGPLLIFVAANPLLHCGTFNSSASSSRHYLASFYIPPSLGTMIFSLMSSWCLAWLNGDDNLWKSSMCGWILYNFSSLCIDIERTARDAGLAFHPRLSRVHAAYKIYNDPEASASPRKATAQRKK